MPFFALLSVSCTDDSRPDASLGQIKTALSDCGIKNAKIAAGVADVTSAFVINFESSTSNGARDCVVKRFDAMNVQQTTAWTGPVGA